MSVWEVTGIAACIVSVVLAVLVIWLSFALYRMSARLSQLTKDQAIGKLGEQLDTLSRDVWTLLRDTVTKGHAHTQAEPPAGGEPTGDNAGNPSGERTAELLEKLLARMDQLVERQEAAAKGLAAVRPRPEPDDAAHDLREAVLGIMASLGGGARASDLIDRLNRGADRPSLRVLDELRRMKEEGVLDWKGEELGPPTWVALVQKPERTAAASLSQIGHHDSASIPGV